MTTSLPRHAARHALAAVLIAPLFACASHRAKPADPAAAPADSAPAARNRRTTRAPREGEASSVEEMLAGKFSGVTVERTNEGGLRIRIRGGNSSFANGEEPLYVVDDVPVPQGTGGVLFLNPHDIAKIEVLKNPADVAIYGMRGVNGVIKVTTKPGGRG